MSTSAQMQIFFFQEVCWLGSLISPDIIQYYRVLLKILLQFYISMSITFHFRLCFICHLYFLIITLFKNILKIMAKSTSQTPYTNVLILTELNKQKSVELTEYTICLLREENIFKIYTENNSLFQNTEIYNKDITNVDYIICVGENSTMMRAMRMLSNQNTIPIISISDGDEPIMSSYSFCELDNVIQNFIRGIHNNNLRIMNTLQFDLYERKTPVPITSFSSELEIHRNMKKSVLKLKLYTRIQSNQFYHLANVWGDGLIISTPFGSMGKNMSLFGPILYKSLQSIILVPISPLSLKFRPVILPATAQILIQVEQSSRSPAQIFADSELIYNQLVPGKQIILSKSNKKTQLVKGLSQKGTEQNWISCLREVVSWGESYHSITDIQKRNSQTE